MTRTYWIVLLLVGVGPGCTRKDQVARLEIPRQTLDLGVLDPGEAGFSVTFHNGGGAPLMVENVKSTCSCTEADATPLVEPAGSGVVRGKVKVQSGPGGADLALTSCAPGGPRLIHVRWFGKSRPTLVPNMLAVSMKVGVGESREVEVSYPAGDPPMPLDFVGVAGLPAGVKVQMVENDPAAIRAIPGLSASMQSAPSPFVGRARLRVDLPAPTAPGPSTFEWLVKFRQGGQAIEIPLKVGLEIHEGLLCQPDWLLFSANDAEALKQVRRTVTLTSDRPGDQFKVVEKPDYLDVTMAPKDAGIATRAIMTASIIAPPPPGEATTRLVLADGTGRQVSVKLYVGVGP